MAYTREIVDIFGRTVSVSMDNLAAFATNVGEIGIQTNGLVTVNNGSTNVDDSATPILSTTTVASLQARNVFNDQSISQQQIAIVVADRVIELGVEGGNFGAIRNVTGASSGHSYTAHMYFLNCTIIIKNRNGDLSNPTIGVPSSLMRDISNPDEDPTCNFYNCRIINDYHFSATETVGGADNQGIGVAGDFFDTSYTLGNPAGHRTNINFAGNSRIRNSNFDGATAHPNVFGGFRGFAINPLNNGLDEFSSVRSTSYGIQLGGQDNQLFGPGFRVNKPVVNDSNPNADGGPTILRVNGDAGVMLTAPYNDYRADHAIMNTSNNRDARIILSAYWEPTVYTDGLLSEGKEGVKANIRTNVAYTTRGDLTSIQNIGATPTFTNFEYNTNSEGKFVGNMDFAGVLADANDTVFDSFAIPVVALTPSFATSSANSSNWNQATAMDEELYTTTVRISDFFGTAAEERTYDESSSYTEANDQLAPVLPFVIENIISVDDNIMTKYYGDTYADRFTRYEDSFGSGKTISFVDLYSLYKRLFDLRISEADDAINPIEDTVDEHFDASGQTFNRIQLVNDTSTGTVFDTNFVQLPNNTIGIVADGFEIHPDTEEYETSASLLTYFNANTSQEAGTYHYSVFDGELTIELNLVQSTAMADGNFVIGNYYGVSENDVAPQARLRFRGFNTTTSTRTNAVFDIVSGQEEFTSRAAITDPSGRRFGSLGIDLFNNWFTLPTEYVIGDELIRTFELDRIDLNNGLFGEGLTLTAERISNAGHVDGNLIQTGTTSIGVRGRITGSIETDGDLEVFGATDNNFVAGATLDAINIDFATAIRVSDTLITCETIDGMSEATFVDGVTIDGNAIVDFENSLSSGDTYSWTQLFGSNFTRTGNITIHSDVPVTVTVPTTDISFYNGAGSPGAITFVADDSGVVFYNVQPVIPSTATTGFFAIRDIDTGNTTHFRTIANGVLVGSVPQVRGDNTANTRVFYKITGSTNDDEYTLRTFDFSAISGDINVEPTSINPYFIQNAAEQTGADGVNPVGATGATNTNNTARFDITWSNTTLAEQASGPGTQYAVLEIIRSSAYFSFLVVNEYQVEPIEFIPDGLRWNNDVTDLTGIDAADGIYNISANDTTANYISNSGAGLRTLPTTISGIQQVSSLDDQEASVGTVIRAVESAIGTNILSPAEFQRVSDELKENQAFVARLNPNLPNT